MTRDEYATRLFAVYNNMRQRCLNPNNPGYSRYGGKGIGIDPCWDTFPAFKEWAESSGYTDSLTLDRKNSALGYSPDNCRWATYQTQSSNQLTNYIKTMQLLKVDPAAAA